MGVAFQRIRHVIDNRPLHILCFDLKEKFERRITTILISSQFHRWKINTSYDFNNEKRSFTQVRENGAINGRKRCKTAKTGVFRHCFTSARNTKKLGEENDGRLLAKKTARKTG
jgi:hypothetical protein